MPPIRIYQGRAEDLAKHPTFVPYFATRKARVRGMDFRCVEIESAPQRAVFEMHASMALGLPEHLWNEH